MPLNSHFGQTLSVDLLPPPHPPAHERVLGSLDEVAIFLFAAAALLNKPIPSFSTDETVIIPEIHHRIVVDFVTACVFKRDVTRLLISSQ